MLTLTFGALAGAALLILLIGIGVGHQAGMRRAEKLRRKHEGFMLRRERTERVKQKLLPWRRVKGE
jgi:serine/threonine protein kinase HipA of HipAB toxin-antitoxin module